MWECLSINFVFLLSYCCFVGFLRRLFSYILFPVCFSTVSSILGAWLDQYSEDFWSPPNYECLHQLLAYLHLHFPGSDLERRARNLLAHFHRRQQCEPDPDGMKAGQERDTRAGRNGGPTVIKTWSVRINQLKAVHISGGSRCSVSVQTLRYLLL